MKTLLALTLGLVFGLASGIYWHEKTVERLIDRNSLFYCRMGFASALYTYSYMGLAQAAQIADAHCIDSEVR